MNETISLPKSLPKKTILGFTRSHSGEIGDIEGFVQLIPGSYKSDKPVNITGIDKCQLKRNCIQGSIANGTREAILYSFGLSSPPGHKIYKELRIRFFRKINKSVLSHISFHLEDDDIQSGNFNGGTISVACQIIKL